MLLNRARSLGQVIKYKSAKKNIMTQTSNSDYLIALSDSHKEDSQTIFLQRFLDIGKNM